MAGVKAKKKNEENELIRKMLAAWKRAQSEYCEVRDSEIHGRGVYAAKAIPKNQRIVEYVGERISKKASERRGNAQHKHSQETGNAAVYIFTLNEKYDLDGNLPWNIARLINHSCSPNCEAQIDRMRIFIYALRDIKAGEELTFDYGFDVDCYEDHPCRCGQKNCKGYIVSRTQWRELDERLEKKKKGKK